MKSTKIFILSILMLLCLITFTTSQGCESQGWKGYGKIHENKTIILTCPSCNYINFTATNSNQEVFLSNVQMSKSGSTFSYTFLGTDLNAVGTYQVDGFSNLDLPIAYCFDITMTGKESSIGTYAILLTLVFLGFILLLWISHKFNRDRRNQLYKKIVQGYFSSKNNGDKNLGTVILYILGYGLLKNLIVFYYLIIVFFLFVLTELVESFGIVSLTLLFTTILNISLWGFILVFLVLAFSLYETIMTLIKDVADSYMGLTNER